MSLSTLSIICLGFDVHKGSITFAVLPSGTKRPRLERLPTDCRSRNGISIDWRASVSSGPATKPGAW
jgi:hypothetical protein